MEAVSTASFFSPGNPFFRKRSSMGRKNCFGLIVSVHSLCSMRASGNGERARRWVAAGARKKKVDSHSFVAKPEEAGFFPESVLLKPKKTQEDGRVLPEFADAEEEQLYEWLNLKMESHLDQERNFIKEKNGKIWRLNNWGLRRLAYKIKKTTHANYILMNFELEAKWIDEFKSLLDKDERIIRHLVMKRDEAITEDCPPPAEFHTVYSNGMDEEDDYFGDDAEGDEQYLDEEDELEMVTYVDGEDEDGDGEDWKKLDITGEGLRKGRKSEKIARRDAMFYSHQLLSRKAPLGQIWSLFLSVSRFSLLCGVVIVYNRKVKLLYGKISGCESIHGEENDVARFFQYDRLTSIRKHMNSDCNVFQVEINAAWRIATENIDPTLLPKGKSQAKSVSIFQLNPSFINLS
ncbi:30S ribosomal protein S6 [Nymphaea thermarum]|nr:30S ribosomal protein S6 [Nymphaea thermarum]